MVKLLSPFNGTKPERENYYRAFEHIKIEVVNTIQVGMRGNAMSLELFVVLRFERDGVETLGPLGQPFTTFDEADRFAKQMRDRYTQRRFVVLQAISYYQTVTLGAIEYADTTATATDSGSKSLKTKVGSGMGQRKRRVAHDTHNNVFRVFPKSNERNNLGGSTYP